MAKEYKDQILDTSVNEKRVYNIVDSDGNIVAENVSLEDKTVYLQDGTEFGAQEVNEIYEAIEEVNSSLNNLNVRYNKESDMMQIFYNGDWIDWQSAGLQWDGILYNGSDASLVDTSKTYTIENMTSNQYSTIAVNANGIVLSPAQTTYNGVAIGSKDKIIPTRFKTLSCISNGITYTVDVSSVTEECYIYVGAYYRGSTNYFVLGLSKTKVNANAQGNILVGIDVVASASTSTITQIRLE